MDDRDQQFPAALPDEAASGGAAELAPTEASSDASTGAEGDRVVPVGRLGPERPATLPAGDLGPEQPAGEVGPEQPVTLRAGEVGPELPAQPAGDVRPERPTTLPAGEVRPGRDAGSGAHGPAKVSWVGRDHHDRPAERKRWLDRIARVLTVEPGPRRPGPAADEVTAPDGELASVEVAAAGETVAGRTASNPSSPAVDGQTTSSPSWPAVAGQTTSDPSSPAVAGQTTSNPSSPAVAGQTTSDPSSPAVAADDVESALRSDPRDEVVFAPARSAPEHLERVTLAVPGANAGGGALEPVFPIAPRRSPVVATVTGVGVGLVALGCFWAGPPAVLALTSVVLAIAMAECYRSLQRAHYQPAAALGLVAAPGAASAAYFEGPLALSIVAAFMVVASFCWYLAGVTRRSAVVNLGATLMGWAWVGLLGGFAGLLLEPAAFGHRHGLAFFIGAVEATVAYDVGAYMFGSWLGKRPMAPRISPKKTWEGLIGGCLAAFAIAVAVVPQMSPWSYGKGALLGVVVAVFAPLGDLAESMVKRELGLKDMGGLLPAHGGALDRVDGLLFALPATYCLVRLLHW